MLKETVSQNFSPPVFSQLARPGPKRDAEKLFHCFTGVNNTDKVNDFIQCLIVLVSDRFGIL
jgi:hypothetical protein